MLVPWDEARIQYAIQRRDLNYGGNGLDTEAQSKFLDLKKKKLF